MDLQGVGAIAAAAVAALGVPAAVVIGRGQTKAAVRGAEATAQAGLKTAEATYRAAIDSARAQADANDRQWARSVRRDAYVALLMASHTLTELAQTYASAPASEDRFRRLADFVKQCTSARTTLRGAYLIAALEAPDDGRLEQEALAVMNATIEYSKLGVRRAALDQAEAALRFLAHAPADAEEPSRDLARDAELELSKLQTTVADNYPDGVAALPLRDAPLEVEEAMATARLALHRLQDHVQSIEQDALIEIAVVGHVIDRPTWRDAVDEIDEARNAYLRAVKSVLSRR